MKTKAATTDMDALDLIKEATRDVRELGHLELALAKEELLGDLSALKATAALAAGAVVLVVLSLALGLVAVGLAFGIVPALIVAGVFFGAALVLAALAYRKLPGKPMGATAKRLELDEAVLKEHPL